MRDECNAKGQTNQSQPWYQFHSTNLAYLHQLYETYRVDPEAVDTDIQALFKQWGPPPFPAHDYLDQSNTSAGILQEGVAAHKLVAAEKLAQNIRKYGHLAANIDPLLEEGPKAAEDFDVMNPKQFGLTDDDLARIPANIIWPDAPEFIRTGLEAMNGLKELYTKSIAFEFDHVHTAEEREWLLHKVESQEVFRPLSAEEKVTLFDRLTEVEEFERFLHRTFVGQKRFSVEGIDMLIPMLDAMIHRIVVNGANDISLGMAHRGRLNVLAHSIGKPYELIFSEFHHAPDKDLVPSEGSIGINYGWTGDVKYHLGANRTYHSSDELSACIRLASNPSHLEFVNPVIEGFTRAAQETRSRSGPPQQDYSKAAAILIHGDAAFPGEGIVAETLNISRLPGYRVGGTIHIIGNNQIGFTTEGEDARSTRYASDLAKGFEIPVVHVNADDPEACLAAVNLAVEYRNQFHKDFLIDLCGYRRFGHNEMDDPLVTQPQLYTKIERHETVRSLYAKQLQAEGIVTDLEINNSMKKVREQLRSAYETVKENRIEHPLTDELVAPDVVSDGLPEIETGVPIDFLHQLNHCLLQWPKEFTVYPKLKNILLRRVDALKNDNDVDWSLAETLAFASILAEGKAVRLTGQDSARGTFSQRHMILHDSDTGETYSPLHFLPQAKASFAIHNSSLSEAAVLGFEYGYNVITTDTLVLWEAQYGDFANAAQVIIDQFLAAGRAKWGQRASLVLLLPHGYEGQGPEHSSARLERFLQLAAENNWSVVNPTSAAQYFHVLRRQAAIVGKEEERPLIIMTPKSLLRHQRTFSSASLLGEGRFQTVLEHEETGNAISSVKRIILCTGKIGVHLENAIEEKEENNWEWVHIVRLEQIYPFPVEKLNNIIERYPNLNEIVWVQEEPKNMGAWTFMCSRFGELTTDGIVVRYIGRPPRSSPAEGVPDYHRVEQERIVSEALKLEEK